MQKFANIWGDEKLLRILKGNGVAIMPTDTLYGIVGRAENKGAVERIYNIRKRDLDKPCIILIGSINELQKFSIEIPSAQKKVLDENWPGPVSIILDCDKSEFEYLHRGTKTLAFRLPKDESLQNLLKETGPLIAPSANPQGLLPAKNIFEAREYFGDKVDMYLDGGEVAGEPSRVIRLFNNGDTNIIRA